MVCGSNKFFGEVFVLKSDKHTCFVMMSYRLCADGNIGKISAQPHTIVKQICFPNGNVLFLSLFSLSNN